MRTLAEIKSKVEELAATIGIPADMLPTYERPVDSGAYIEVDDCEYKYVTADRGRECSRTATAEFDELLFQIFSSATWYAAVEYELQHRAELLDCRRMIFDRQIQLLTTLSPIWAGRVIAEHKQILADHPFDDFAGYFASCIGKYVEAGFAYGDACKLAYVKTKTAQFWGWLKSLWVKA